MLSNHHHYYYYLAFFFLFGFLYHSTVSLLVQPSAGSIPQSLPSFIQSIIPSSSPRPMSPMHGPQSLPIIYRSHSVPVAWVSLLFLEHMRRLPPQALCACFPSPAICMASSVTSIRFLHITVTSTVRLPLAPV